MSRLGLSCLLVTGLLLSACAHQMPRVEPPRDERPALRPAPLETREQGAKPELFQSPDAAPPRTESERSAAFPDVAYLDKRLFAYQEKFLLWQAVDDQLAVGAEGVEAIDAGGRWVQCFQDLRILYDHYGQLREQSAFGLRQERIPERVVDPWEVFRADIGYLESDCEAVYQQVREQLAQREKERSEPARKFEAAVIDHLENFRYQQGVQTYRGLERRYSGWQPSLDVRHAYGLALLHTGQIDKAGPVLLEVLPQLDAAAQLVLKRVIADIMWATHRFDEARALYLSLSHHFASLKDNEHWVADQLAILENVDVRAPEMAAYISLLRVYLSFDGRRIPDGLEEAAAGITRSFPGSIIDQRARQILQYTRERVRGWFESRIASAATLKDEKQFSKAMAVLESLQQEAPTAESRIILEQLMEEVLQAEAAEKEKERLRLEQDLAGRWEEASHLLDLEHYDEAYAIFVSLLGTEFDARARGRMKEAANRAASEMRRQAANLFVRARESGSAERKMNLLLESRRLLKNVIEKYPEADIISNVNRNLEVIEQHIRELGP